MSEAVTAYFFEDHGDHGLISFSTESVSHIPDMFVHFRTTGETVSYALMREPCGEIVPNGGQYGGDRKYAAQVPFILAGRGTEFVRRFGN
jgi:hypothetical protein